MTKGQHRAHRRSRLTKLADKLILIFNEHWDELSPVERECVAIVIDALDRIADGA